jgi:hypothetical protein
MLRHFLRFAASSYRLSGYQRGRRASQGDSSDHPNTYTSDHFSLFGISWVRKAVRHSLAARVLFHGATDAIFVGGQELKLTGVVHPGLGLGEGGVGLRVATIRREVSFR